MASRSKKICVIGAGPSGLAVLFHFATINTDNHVKIVCFEKQSTWKGMWIYTGHQETDEDDIFNKTEHHWRTNRCHSNQHDIVSDDCSDNPSISNPSTLSLRDYLEGRWKNRVDLDQFIRPHELVRYVQFNDDLDNFSVTSTNLVTNETSIETFSHVIVATGIFNVPIVPSFPGIETFKGQIVYAHCIHNAEGIKGQRLLIVGAPYSIQDLATRCMKSGAKSVICTYRTKQASVRLANGIDQRPWLQKFEGNVAYFKDRSFADIDCVVIGTGYIYSYRFMEDRLRLKSSPTFYPDNLYKGSVWMGVGHNKLFYIGTQDRLYSLTLFDAQGIWVCKYILEKLSDEPKSTYEMRRSVKEWVRLSSRASSLDGYVKFLKDFILDLSKDFGCLMYTSTSELTANRLSKSRSEHGHEISSRRRLMSTPESTCRSNRPFVRFHSLHDDKGH
ncbi:hypothetical protein ACF0H5_011202 [Mactra antiquata]